MPASTRVYWVDGPWLGKLALAARPRGGEWLDDEIEGWQRNGVDTIFSLLTKEEERELDISGEQSGALAHGMNFYSFPIPDLEVPASEDSLAQTIEPVDRELSGGRNVVVHCRQGIGRSGLVAACLLLKHGVGPETAVQKLSAARGVTVPETAEQRRWIDHYAESFAARDDRSAVAQAASSGQLTQPGKADNVREGRDGHIDPFACTRSGTLPQGNS